MADELTWQLMLHEPPRRVFHALVSSAAQHERLGDVEHLRRALTITPPCEAAAAGYLRVVVTAEPGGTLVHIRPLDLADAAVGAESIGSLIRGVRSWFTNAVP